MPQFDCIEKFIPPKFSKKDVKPRKNPKKWNPLKDPRQPALFPGIKPK